MLLLTLYSVLLTVISTTLATPIRPHHLTKLHPQGYFLRANCPHEPWHNRQIVSLPTTHQLGLENFTVAPTTPGLQFRPIALPSGAYALRGSGASDDQDCAPFLVALVSTSTRTASMAVLDIEKPCLGHSFRANVEDACWEGYECVADQWGFGAEGGEGVRGELSFGGFEGSLVPMKDAPNSEGWHVYWKGGAGLFHPIQLDLVPGEDDHGY